MVLGRFRSFHNLYPGQNKVVRCEKLASVNKKSFEVKKKEIAKYIVDFKFTNTKTINKRNLLSQRVAVKLLNQFRTCQVSAKTYPSMKSINQHFFNTYTSTLLL